MLDIDKILVDHEGDSACGENLEYDSLLLEVREAIEGKPEQQIGDDVIEGEEPDWKTVKKNCLELCGKTHNLEVVISLSQALMNLEGFAGLSDASKLLEGLIEKYWVCLHPQLDPDDNDPIERLNMLALFEDFKFLLSVQKIELLKSKGIGSVNLYDIRNSKTENCDEAKDAKLIDAIFQSCSEEDKEQVFSHLDQIISNFQRITTLLQEEETVGGSNAPGFKELIQILSESKSAIGAHLSNNETNDVDVDDNSETSDLSSNSGNVKSTGINSRQDVISSIDKIEDYYLKNEPGSPIPLLLQRAKSLVNKDFIALMEELSPDSLHQLEIILGKSQSNDNDEY